jgi:dTMP kinase
MLSESQTGFFITFEGSEGCGKSTQIGLLLENLRACGQKPLAVREPGGTPLGEQIRHILKHSDEGSTMTPETELLLFGASRAQLVREVIGPALAAGRVVISDRFFDSTTVYQGVARAIDPISVAAINRFAAGSRLPDVTFLLDMDSAQAFKRAMIRRTPEELADRMEQEPLAFYEAVRQGYLALAQAEPSRFCVLDATLPPSEIAGIIRTELYRRSHALFEGIRP